MAWYYANQEKASVRRRAYYALHRHEYVADRALRYQAEKTEATAAWRRWNLENYDRQRARVRAWQLANRPKIYEHVRTMKNRRRAAIAGSACITFTTAAWRSVLAYHDNRCAYCLRSVDGCGRLEHDHVIALSCGGDHSIDNIVPACRSCNATKGAKSLLHFIQRQTTPVGQSAT